MSIGTHLLGRRQEHDPASRNYQHPIKAIRATQLQPVTHTLAMPHLDQGNLGSCEGNTAAEFLGSAKAVRNRRAFNAGQGRGRTDRYPSEADAVSLYTLATHRDQFPGGMPKEDTGTSGLGVAKAMVEFKAIERYEWTFTFPDFLSTLQTRPVMLGTDWYDSQFTYDEHGVIRPSGSVAGGHAYLAFAWRPAGYRLPDGFVLPWNASGCTNHWVQDDGSPWGVRIGKHDGCFWIPDPDLEQLLIHEGGESLVPVLM